MGRVGVCGAWVALYLLTACRGGTPAHRELLEGVAATCASTSGQVEMRRARQLEWEPAPLGSLLRDGDSVRTGPRARAKVEFLKGGGLGIAENATVVLYAGPGNTAPLVAVKSGTVWGTVPQVERGAQWFPLSFQTASGSRFHLIRIAGTGDLEFEVSGTPEGSQVSIRGGAARLALDGADWLMGVGQIAEVSGSTVAVGEAPAPPESLSPRPDARVHCDGTPIPLRWFTSVQAASYRVQVARDLSFQRLAVSEVLKSGSIDFVPPEPGVWAWRVAAIDGLGRSSDFGRIRLLFCEKDAPRELLSEPEDGAAKEGTEREIPVKFAWQSDSPSSTSWLILSKSPDLRSDSVEAVRVPGSATELRNVTISLAPGDYYWGVYVDGDPASPLFLEPRQLTVRAAAIAPLAVRTAPPTRAPASSAQAHVPAASGQPSPAAPAQDLSTPESIEDWGD